MSDCDLLLNPAIFMSYNWFHKKQNHRLKMAPMLKVIVDIFIDRNTNIT